MREKILASLSDAITDFLYYDRKEDDWLGVGEIEAAIACGEITISEMTVYVYKRLTQAHTEYLKDKNK